MLYNPDKSIVIRQNPIADNICCDKLLSKGRVKQLGSCDCESVNEAFARFANNGTIEPKGWYEIESLETKQLNNYYYGNRE